jgi:mxaJ protein
VSARACIAAAAAALGMACADTVPPAAQPTATATAPPPPSPRVLRVCADPNNMPFSNARGEGFENRLAAMLADDLHARLSYTWWPQRRGFVRATLGAGRCDVIPGVPAGWERVLSTRPYYRSGYVFVTRADRRLRLSSLDDPALRRLRIGVQLAGDDYANTPPAHALAQRGVVGRLVGYTLYGDYGQESPPARIVSAVAAGEVDTAIVWGPLAGYFAPRQPVALNVQPVPAPADLPFLPFEWDIAMGVRKGDAALQAELDAFLTRRRPQIDRLLDGYGVPRVARRGGRT